MYQLTRAEELPTVARQMIEKAVVGDGWADFMYERIFARKPFINKHMSALPVTIKTHIWEIYQSSSDVIHGISLPSEPEWENHWSQEIVWIKLITPWVDIHKQ